MKITVDSNIVFSAILNSRGKIGQLIINGSRYFKFYSVNLLKQEIVEHKNKILKSSGLTELQFEKAFQLITDRTGLSLPKEDSVRLKDTMLTEGNVVLRDANAMLPEGNVVLRDANFTNYRSIFRR